MVAQKKLAPPVDQARAVPDEDRSSERYRLHFPVTTAHPEGGTVSATVRNLSNNGMLLDTEAALPLGTQLVVELPATGTVLAEIVRQQQGLYGCEFRSRVPDAAVREAIRQSPVAWLRPEAGRPADRADPSGAAVAEIEPGGAEAQAEAPRRWPIAARFAFIVIASVLLWGLILLGVSLAVA